MARSIIVRDARKLRADLAIMQRLHNALELDTALPSRTLKTYQTLLASCMTAFSDWLVVCEKKEGIYVAPEARKRVPGATKKPLYVRDLRRLSTDIASLRRLQTSVAWDPEIPKARREKLADSLGPALDAMLGLFKRRYEAERKANPEDTIALHAPSRLFAALNA